MGTKNNPGDFDCYAEAGDDEPVFVLLARDPVAASVVRYWVERRELKTLGTDAEVSKRNDALKCADEMEKWRFIALSE